jgi:hypothetical protein
MYGQLLYIVVASALYVSFLIIMSMLVLLPYIEFTTDWGKVLSTLSQTNASSYSSLPIYYSLQQNYSPTQALLLSALLLFLITVFIGLVMFVLNLSTQRAIGIVGGFLLAFLPSLLHRSGAPQHYYFAPTTWADLGIMSISDISLYPSISYAIIVLLSLNIILMLTGILISRRQSIEITLSI